MFVVILVLHELSVLHAEECDAMSRNVVKRPANQNRVNCSFDVIGQSDRLNFLRSREKYMLRGYWTVKNGEDKMLF